MKWSRDKLRTALKLHQIKRAQQKATEARLAVANSRERDAEEARSSAEGVLAEAESGWKRQIGAGRFNLDLGQVFAAQLLASESELRDCEARRNEARGETDREREAWQKLETNVRSGGRALRDGRRKLTKKAEAAYDQALSERTTWKWFSR